MVLTARAEDAGAGAPATSRAREVLALHAGVLTATRDARSRPGRWLTGPFGKDVDTILAHLGAIRSPELLAESFSRESSYLLRTRHLSVPEAQHVLATSAVDVAYALRWLELSDAAPVRRWLDWIGGPSHPLTVVGDARQGDLQLGGAPPEGGTVDSSPG